MTNDSLYASTQVAITFNPYQGLKLTGATGATGPAGPKSRLPLIPIRD